MQLIVLLFAMLTVISCSNSTINKEFTQLEKGKIEAKGLEMVYPYNGTIFPPEFPAPTFEWKSKDDVESEWNVFISDRNGKVLISTKTINASWKPDAVEWENIKRKSENNFAFTVIGNKQVGSNLQSARILFSFSNDSVGADIFFRAVTLPFSYAVKNVNTIEWYMGSVDGSAPRKMLDNMPVCANCHSFAKDEPLLAMDVDYGNDKGSYVIAEAKDTAELKPNNIITWSNFKRNDGEPTYGLLSQISPDGNHVLSTVKDLSIFVAVDDNMAYSQLFFPIKGIIGIYDRKSKAFSALEGANDEKYVQSNPTWSPDGKKVIFAKTEAYVNEKVKRAGKALLSITDVEEFTSGKKQFKYDLYTVDFNQGKGGIAVPLKGASNNGKSNYFPKFSPDGKWIVFCQADNFMLLQPDSRLYIIPAEGGEPRLMNCNMNEMNSWHSWSPNGRWMVFSSKNKGLYTQLYLTHIDENGMDSPPVLLENLQFDERAANIPEFFPHHSKQFDLIKNSFSQTAEYYNRGAFDKLSNKYYKRAMLDLNKALEVDNKYIETYFNRIMLNNILRQTNSKVDLADKKMAMQLVLDSLSKKPGDENFIALKISLLSNMGKYDVALNEAKTAVNKYPSSYKINELLSTIYRKLKDHNNAIICYNTMLKIDPSKKSIINLLVAGSYVSLNQIDKALVVVQQGLKDQPGDAEYLFTRSQIYIQQKKFDLAKSDIDQLLATDPDNQRYNDLLAQFHVVTGNQQGFYDQKKKVLQQLNKRYTNNTEDVDALFEMAALYMSVKDFSNAENLYNLVLKDYPINYEALKQKAVIKLNAQQWADAIAIYAQLDANYPPEEGFYNNAAIAYYQLGDFDNSMAYFDKTLKLNPNNKDAAFNKNKLKTERQKRN